MFNFWFELPPLLRAGMGLLLIVIGVVIFAATGGLVAVGIFVAGLAMIIFCKAGSNNGGYNF